MNPTIKKNRSFFVRITLVIWAFLAYGIPPLNAQTTYAMTLEKALTSLNAFQVDIRNMRNVANIPLGPYRLDTKCTWCSERAWWGLGLCTQETTETWGTTVDFSWTRTHLDAALQDTDQNAAAFLKSYAPTQDWIKGVARLSAQFDEVNTLILGIQQTIKAGVAPTEQQRQTVITALNDLTHALSASASQLQAGIGPLAMFMQSQSRSMDLIQEAIDGASKSAQDALEDLSKSTQNHHCQDGLQDKFQQIRAEFQNSIQKISEAFQRLQVSNHDAQSGQAALLGAVINSLSQVNASLSLVQAASADTLGSFLEQIHLSTAKAIWNDLAKCAGDPL